MLDVLLKPGEKVLRIISYAHISRPSVHTFNNSILGDGVFNAIDILVCKLREQRPASKPSSKELGDKYFRSYEYGSSVQLLNNSVSNQR